MLPKIQFMLYLRNLARKLFILTCLFFSTAQAQTQEQINAALSALQSKSPEQIEALLQMVVTMMPPDKKSDIETALKLMKATSPETQTVQWKNKTIVMVPIAHASTPKFYEGVKTIVNDYKAKGYVVFYEQIKQEGTKGIKGTTTPTNTTTDTLGLKLRKLVGLEPTRQTYAILKNFFPDIIPQPEYKELGITASDVNADISLEQLVGKYEALYGGVVLSPCDFESKSAGILYNCGALTNDIEPVILDYRNENVARLIKSAATDKILLIYGAKHIPGIIKLLSEG